MTTETMQPPVPVPDPDSAGFWDALRNGHLSIARCESCRRWQHPPTETCRACGGALEFQPVKGTGTVYSFIVVRQALVPGHDVPHTIAVVQLDEQDDLLLSGVLHNPVDDVAIGMRVRVDVVAVGSSEFCAPEFVPAAP